MFAGPPPPSHRRAATRAPLEMRTLQIEVGVKGRGQTEHLPGRGKSASAVRPGRRSAGPPPGLGKGAGAWAEERWVEGRGRARAVLT